MENDSKYQMYARDLLRNVPNEYVSYLIALFMQEAAVNMGSEVDNKTLERVIYYIQRDYSYIPVSFIASAFIRGSLGKIGDGKGRLVPKTIIAWIGESSMDYNRMLSSEREKAKLNDVSIAMDLHKYPVGSAICKKIEWYKNGSLKIDDWDKVPLKDIAEKIKQGHHVTPQMFGIIYKN